MPLVDNEDTTLREKEWQNAAHIRLYDPPVDGKTPTDGAGKPRTSLCVLRDKESQIAAGFSTYVVGWEGAWPELGDWPVNPADTGFTVDEVAPPVVEKPVKKERKSVVKRSTNRTRTVKR